MTSLEDIWNGTVPEDRREEEDNLEPEYSWEEHNKKEWPLDTEKI